MSVIYAFLFLTLMAGVSARIVTGTTPRPEWAWISWVVLVAFVISTISICLLAMSWPFLGCLVAPVAVGALGYHYREAGVGLGRLLMRPKWLMLVLALVAFWLLLREWPGNPSFQADVWTLLLLCAAICIMLGRNPLKPSKKS